MVALPSNPLDLGSIARLVVEGHGAAPAAVVAATLGRRANAIGGEGAAGRLDPSAEAALAGVDTPFDLASVTKPIVALTLARLERRGVLRRTARLGEVLRFVRDSPTGDVSLDLLAAHRAGLEAHIKIFAPLLEGKTVTRDDAVRIAAASRRSDAVGPAPERWLRARL